MDHATDTDPGPPHLRPPWLFSPLLAAIPGLVHGFGTRHAGNFADPAAERRLLAASRARRLLLLRQVHGDRVAAPPAGDGRPEADAWAGTPDDGFLLGVLTADCLPVLLCHPSTGALGAAHAGWRGAAAGVVRATLDSMGSPPGEVRAALGPCIGPCCYPVGPEVAEAAGEGPWLAAWPGRPGRFRLDLRGLVRDQLLRARVPPEAVEASPLCTSCRSDLFFSYRRDGPTGRLCSFLGWTARGGRSGGDAP